MPNYEGYLDFIRGERGLPPNPSCDSSEDQQGSNEDVGQDFDYEEENETD